MFEVNSKGIRISDTSLWLDATKKVDLSFISHAHADHIKKHNKIVATPATIDFYRQRCKEVNHIALDYGVPYELENITIELFPSGHILGAAQILITKNGKRLVYTGDFNLQQSATAQPLEIRETDILIMECTFGLPEYVFPKRWEVIERLAKFVEKCFQNGLVPVVMSYSLGKSQEVIKILGDLDYPISVHSSIYQMTKIYEQHGIEFKNWQLYNGEDLRDRILIIPPYLKNWVVKHYQGAIRKIIVTGWAIDENVKFRYGADEAIPLSDHADFNDLINYVKQVSPQKVYITHGFDKFAYYLNRQGYDASPLRPTSQISLF